MRHNSMKMPASRRGKVFRNSRFGGKVNQGKYINPEKFINAAIEPHEEAVFVAKHKFSDFGFIQGLQANVEAKGFTTPTPIQDASINVVMNGQDLIGLANTGTGKTAAFVLPIIQRLKTNHTGRTSLIIAPTRELAIQIQDEFKDFARGLQLYSALCVGGMNIKRQKSQLARRPQVVIGTPGRLKDLFNQGALKLHTVGVLVLDEADRMLDMGFIRDIRFLLEQLPAERQSLCFSATIPPEVRRLLDGILNDPVTVSVRTSETSDHVEQNVIKAVSKDHKIEILMDMLKESGYKKVLIFGQTKWSVQRLSEALTKAGISSEAIHGNKSQPQRQRALEAFKQERVQVLVATDVASRGLDIPNVSHVINFDQPNTYEDYVHRIGRTGRAGNKGNALTFV